MKTSRQNKILEIISSQDIETQHQLMEALREHGVKSTQATVSRDIKELRLLKVLADNGGYKYATVDKAEKGLSERFIRIFSESTLSMQSAENIIVIKTLSGSANAAAEAVDSLRWPEIVGSLAGDNTILVVIKDKEHVQNVMDKFNAMIKK